MSGLIVRRAGSCDVETLVTLRLEMRREREDAVLEIPESEFAALLRNYFADAVKNGTFVSFIVWDGETAAACSGLSVVALPPSYGDLSGKKGYITNMYTRQSYRGRGIARKLLDSLKEYAKSEGCTTLALNASDAGYPVYKKYGFKDVSGEMKLKIRD